MPDPARTFSDEECTIILEALPRFLALHKHDEHWIGLLVLIEEMATELMRRNKAMVLEYQV